MTKETRYGEIERLRCKKSKNAYECEIELKNGQKKRWKGRKIRIEGNFTEIHSLASTTPRVEVFADHKGDGMPLDVVIEDGTEIKTFTIPELSSKAIKCASKVEGGIKTLVCKIKEK